MPPRLASVGSYSITDLSTADRPDSYRMESVRSRCDDNEEDVSWQLHTLPGRARLRSVPSSPPSHLERTLSRDGCHGPAKCDQDFQADGRCADRRDRRRPFLGPGTGRLRCARLCHRAQGLCGPDARADRWTETRQDRPRCRDDRGGGSPHGSGGDRPNQERRGSVPGAAGAGSDGGRPGRTLHDGACRGELQARDGRDLPARARPLHPAGTGRAQDFGGRAVACVGRSGAASARTS